MTALLSKTMFVRISEDISKKFAKKAKTYGMLPSMIHRELITAFVEDRMTISAPKLIEPTKRSLYHD